MSESGDDWRAPRDSGGSTPLTEDEKNGLRTPWVATHADLNEAEAANIERALRQRRWARFTVDELLDDKVQRDLHHAMFCDVWRWAGHYRTTEKNIGCNPIHIAVRVRDLCGDTKYWFRDATRLDEAACRFHHRLVAVHPFANGNGRHARAATNLLLIAAGGQPFTWGRVNLVSATHTRREYISALRAADDGDLGRLLIFARS